MNNIPLLERLANKALKHPDTDNDGLTVFDNDELKKFAELVVRECISIVDDAERGGSNDIWDNAVKFIKRDLQEHFGVEE